MAKTLSYINTDPRGKSGNQQAGGAGSYAGAYRSHSVPSGLTMIEVIGRIMPAIAENYADSQKEFSMESFLFNPSFSNNAEGWNFKEEEWGTNVRIQISDNKNRLFLSSGGYVSQSNQNIRKPGKHFEYFVPEDEGDNDGNPPEIIQEGPQTDVTINTVDWEDLEVPNNVVEKEEKTDSLYLSIEVICHKNGVLSAGFVGSVNTDEKSLKFTERSLEASENPYTIEEIGTWDGTGDFMLSFSEGEIEVVSLRLLGKPLEEFRIQTDSAVNQTLFNLKSVFKVLELVKERFSIVESDLNTLYLNDSIINERVKKTEDNMNKLADLSTKLNSFAETLETLENTVKNLSERVEKLESL